MSSERNVAALDVIGDLDEGAGLLAAEAERPQRVGVETCDVASLGKGERATCARGQATVGRGEPVEQLDADRECELLAGDCVRQALEQRGESGRLQPAELLGQLAEVADR